MFLNHFLFCYISPSALHHSPNPDPSPLAALVCLSCNGKTTDPSSHWAKSIGANTSITVVPKYILLCGSRYSFMTHINYKPGRCGCLVVGFVPELSLRLNCFSEWMFFPHSRAKWISDLLLICSPAGCGPLVTGRKMGRLGILGEISALICISHSR